MINIYMGENGQGKTLLLEDYIINSDDKLNIVTNVVDIIDMGSRGLDENRVNIIQDKHIRDRLFDGYEVVNSGGQIVITEQKQLFSKAYFDIITLLCTKGNILILDEPDDGLDTQETSKLQEAFILLLPTYKDVMLAFHSQHLLGMEDYIELQYYWVSKYRNIAVSEEQIYDAIGTI